MASLAVPFLGLLFESLHARSMGNPASRHSGTGPLGHIPDAMNIPLNALEGRISELTEKQQSIVLVCKTDKRSAKAADLFRNKGIREVMVLRGGMEEWNRQILPSELGAGADSCRQ